MMQPAAAATANRRLAFATGFFRFMLEVCHRNMQILARGSAGDAQQPPPQDEWPETDEDEHYAMAASTEPHDPAATRPGTHHYQ